MAIKRDFDAIFDNLTSVNMKKFLMSLGFIAICTSAFATIEYTTTCGKQGYTVNQSYFVDNPDEFWNYLFELNEIECGVPGPVKFKSDTPMEFRF